MTFRPNFSSIYDAQVRWYTCILVPTVLLHFCYGRQLEVFKGFLSFKREMTWKPYFLPSERFFQTRLLRLPITDHKCLTMKKLRKIINHSRAIRFFIWNPQQVTYNRCWNLAKKPFSISIMNSCCRFLLFKSIVRSKWKSDFWISNLTYINPIIVSNCIKMLNSFWIPNANLHFGLDSTS